MDIKSLFQEVSNLRMNMRYFTDVVFSHIFCSSADRPGLIYEQMLMGDISSHVIDTLEEDKEYKVNIYAIYPEGLSEPVSITGKTCKSISSFFFLLFLYFYCIFSSHASCIICPSKIIVCHYDVI